jgi:NADPH:quinone reductase-like Zn-dependent oxidoreductase
VEHAGKATALAFQAEVDSTYPMSDISQPLALRALAPGQIECIPSVQDRPESVELELVVAAISPLDRQVADGRFPPAKPFPLTLGTSAVARDRAGVEYFAFAESVGGGLVRDGIHAANFSLPESALVPLPADVDREQAAAALTSLATARSILLDIAKIESGARLLVLGGNGSVGRASLAIGKLLGLTMAVATRDGLDIDGVAGVKNSEIATSAKEILGGMADVIIDPVGGEVTGQALMAGGADCKHVLLGFSAGPMLSLLAPRFLGFEHQLIGFNLLRRSHERVHQHVVDSVEDLRSGRFTAEIDSRFSLVDGASAYATAAKVRGRVLIK